MSKSYDKKEKIIFFIYLLLTIVYSFNILQKPILPFADSPNHIAESFLLQKHRENPKFELFNYYSLNYTTFTPNTFHTLVTSLFGDVEVSNQLFYLISLLVFLFVNFKLFEVSNLKKNPYIFYVFVLLYNFNVFWGFTGFVAGISITLLIFLLSIYYLRQKNKIYLLLIFILTFVNYYSNVQTYLLQLEILFFIIVFIKANYLTKISLSSVQIPALFALIVWVSSSISFTNSESTIEFLSGYYLHEYLPEIPRRLYRLLWLDNYRIFDGNYGRFVASIFTIPIIIIFVFTVFRKIRNSQKTFFDWNINANEERKIFIIILCVALINYILLPDRLPGQSFLYQRFSFLLLLSMAFYLACNQEYIVKFYQGPIIFTLIFLHSLLWTHYFDDFKKEAILFNNIIHNNKLIKEKKLGYICSEKGFRGHGVFNNFLNYHLIWNNGIVATEITNYRFRIVDLLKPLPRKQILNDELITDKDLIRIINQQSSMDFLLFNGENLNKIVKSMYGDKIVSENKRWLLIKN